MSAPSLPGPDAAVPPDDAGRPFVLVRPDDAALPHFALAGNTYTVLLTGEDTDGRYTLIDMYVPPGGGPPPHRHDFEELFSVLEGEVEVTCRGATATVRAGESANVPANAPHAFRNGSSRPARMLCMASPAGLERFVAGIGDRVAGRTAAAPAGSEMGGAEWEARAEDLGRQHRIEPVRPT